MTYSHPISTIQDWRRFPLEWALRRTVAPALEPFTLDEVRDQLRLVAQDDDALLQSYIVGAREAMESLLGKALLTQIWELNLSRFPSWELPLPWTGDLGYQDLLQSVTSITYRDVNDVRQTRDPSLYEVDAHHQPVARIVPAYGLFWAPTRPMPNAVTVTYVAGLNGRGDIPQMVRQAMLMVVGSLYENREADVVAAQILERLPIFGELVDSHRSRWEPEFN